MMAVRRLLFLFACGTVVPTALGARETAPARPAQPPTDAQIETLAVRQQVVSAEFRAALQQATRRAKRVNGALDRVAHALDRLAGD